MKNGRGSLLRQLPGVDELIRTEVLSTKLCRYSHKVIADAARDVLENLRKELLLKSSGTQTKAVTRTVEEIAQMAADNLEVFNGTGLKEVVNGTGTILHTNLGRALLAQEAAKAAYEAATRAVGLEMDISTGQRSERDHTAEKLICTLTGAEAACVVNNNAGAVLLVLNTLAEHKEVVVSRGELIEIGGSFRLPDIIEKSGCILKEVGTTNRTHGADYTKAVTERTALFFKAHTSNYKVVGFTAEVGLKELVLLAANSGVAVVEDLGAGALVDMAEFGLPHEPVVKERLEAGADIVTFSGDKLLGGPQCGIIAGRHKLVDKIRSNPLKRVLRCDKMTLAALEATLKLYLNTKELSTRLPLLRTVTRPVEEIAANAQKAAAILRKRLGTGFTVEVHDYGVNHADGSVIGGGAMPGYTLATSVIKISHTELTAKSIYESFLKSVPPVLGRISKGCFLIDMRTVTKPEDLLSGAQV